MARQTKHQQLVADAMARLHAHGWSNIEVKPSTGMLAGRYTTLTAESEPETVFLNTRINVYVRARSVSVTVFPFGVPSRDFTGKYGWTSAISAYGRTR